MPEFYCRFIVSGTDCFFFSSRRRHTRLQGDWSSDVCSSDLVMEADADDASGIIDESGELQLPTGIGRQERVQVQHDAILPQESNADGGVRGVRDRKSGV